MQNSERMNRLLEMLQKEPSDAFLNHALALEYLAIGNLETAKKIFEKVIAEQGQYLASYYQLGQTLEKLGENENAILIYRRGIELAKKQNNKKAMGELSEALWMLED